MSYPRHPLHSRRIRIRGISPPAEPGKEAATQAAPNLPKDKPLLVPDLLPLSLPILPQSRASRGVPFGLLCGARTPRSGGAARPPGTVGVRPAARALRPDFISWCPEAVSWARAPAQHVGKPGTRKLALFARREKRCCGPGGRRGVLAGAGFSSARGPVQNFRPWPGSHGPRSRSQTPPPLPSVLQSLARPRGHLDARARAQIPRPLPQPWGLE